MFPLSYEIAAEVRDLKPLGGLFRLEGDEFERAYRAHLDRVGVDRLQRGFAQIAATHPEPLVLLCFERPDEPCHRFTFVRWWLERTGQRIEEVTPCTPS
jgi:hypothetical protein